MNEEWDSEVDWHMCEKLGNNREIILRAIDSMFDQIFESDENNILIFC